MFRKIMAGSLLTSALPLAALAVSSMPAPNLNPYAGAYIGAAVGAFTFSGNTLSTTGPGGSVINTLRGSKTGVAGQLNGGYLFPLNSRWLLGASLFANTDNAYVQQISNFLVALPGPTILPATTNIKTTNRYNVGVTFDLGYTWNHADLFRLFAGPAWANMQVAQINTVSTFPSTNETYSKTLGGAVVGVALDQKITKHLSLSERFSYSFISNWNLLFVNSIVQTQNQTKQTSMATFIGLNYWFSGN